MSARKPVKRAATDAKAGIHTGMSRKSAEILPAHKKGRPGQPAYTPTPADRATVLAMSAAGIPQAAIAGCIGTRGISEPTLRKHFAHELSVGTTKLNGLCVQGIVKAMEAGEAWALCFWAKCRMGWREREKVIPPQVDDAGGTWEEFLRIYQKQESGALR